MGIVNRTKRIRIVCRLLIIFRR